MASTEAQGPVPVEVATAVASFLRARVGDSQRWTQAENVNAVRAAHLTLVRDWDQAHRLGHWVTEDCLALTMLSAAAEYRDHARFDLKWDAWTPFGDLHPHSEV